MTLAPERGTEPAAGGPVPAPLPAGFAVRASRRTRVAATDDGGLLLLGGTAGTVLRLSAAAARRLPDGPRPGLVVRDPTDARLARALLDAGMADPDLPPIPRDLAGVTVVVPVHEDAAGLATLLAALPPAVAVVVVDDASADPVRVAAVVAGRPGAVLLRHEVNAGPAAARNTGLLAVGTPVVCFCDADVVPGPGAQWLERLLGHLDDPQVGLVAPRVTALPPAHPAPEPWVAAYERARSSLDLGDLPAAVRPGGAVSYLPSACLLARTAAVADGFATAMRVAEDVDLVWRCVGAGWRARYEPAASVGHRHRTDPVAWLRRKAFYGSGAALLAARHGDAVAPAVLAPWTAATAVAVLAQRRWSAPVALGVAALTTHRLAGRVPHAVHPHRVAARLVGSGLLATAQQTAGLALRHHWPLALTACVVSRRARRALVVAAVAEGLADRHRVGATTDRVGYVAAHRLDDLAYGAGLWWGAVRARSPRALLPRWTTTRRR